MSLRLKMIPILGIYILLISATCIVKKDTTVDNRQNITITNNGSAHFLRTHKLNFFQRLGLKILLKRNRNQNSLNADNLASTSLWLGIGACGFILLGLFVPFIILLSVPTGIAAMITGGSALRNKTSLVGKARTGKGLGLGALIAFGLLLLLAAIVISSVGIW
jgi:hypothetical protein